MHAGNLIIFLLESNHALDLFANKGLFFCIRRADGQKEKHRNVLAMYMGYLASEPLHLTVQTY